MIDLQALLGEVEPEQSILLTFALGLTQLDYALLPLLQSHGEGRVTVVADPGGVEAAFAERATAYGPGVRYRLLPYHPPSGLAFHPKLYLVAGRTGARLVVTSANLTLYGFRENLEIVDVAALGPDDREESHLFVQALEFLDRLAALDATVGPLLGSDVTGMRRRLERWLGDTKPGATGALLHSLDRPLMDQVAAMVPADEIEHILCVSPFYDGEGKMLRELSARYRGADIDLVGPEEDWTDLSGKRLADLSNRIHPHRLHGVGGKGRRLHAKLLAFRGRTRAWTVAGSANATRPAWLGAASKPRSGNVEVVIVREHQDAALMDELRESLDMAPVELASFTFDRSTLKGDEESGAALSVIRAEQEGSDRIAVTARVRGLSAAGLTFRVRVEGRTAALDGDAQVTDGDETGRLRLQAPLSLRSFEDDLGPLILGVEAVQGGRRVAQGRAWLERPDLLNLTSHQRRIQSLIERTKRSGRVGEEEVQDIADAISRFVSDILHHPSFDLDHTPDAISGVDGGDRGETDVPESEDSKPEEFTLPSETMPLHRASSPSGQIIGILQQISEALRQQFEGVVVKDPVDTVEDTKGGNKSSSPESGRFPPLRASVHRAVHSKVTEPLIEMLRVGRDGLNLTHVLHATSPLSWLLLSLAASERRRLEGMRARDLEREDHEAASRRREQMREAERTVHQAVENLVDLMVLLFSTDGLVRGTPTGLLLTSWLKDPEQVAEALSQEQAEGFLIAAAIASSLVPHKQGSVHQLAGGLWLLLADREDWAGVEDFEERLVPRGREVAKAFGDVFTTEQLLSVIHEAREATADILELAEWWAPVYCLAKQEGNPSTLEHAREVVEGSKAGRSLLRVLDRLIERGDTRPIVAADVDAESKSCGRCRVGIPVGQLARLNDPRNPYLQCEGCGGLIAPVDDPAIEPTKRIVRTLRHLVLEA